MDYTLACGGGGGKPTRWVEKSVSEGKEVITVFFSRWINYKVVCCSHEDSYYHHKKKTLPLCCALIFSKNWMPWDIYGNTKAWKRKKKKKKTVQPLGVPGSSAERFGGEMSRRQRLGLTLCWFPPPIRQWNLIPGGWLTKMEGQKRA